MQGGAGLYIITDNAEEINVSRCSFIDNIQELDLDSYTGDLYRVGGGGLFVESGYSHSYWGAVTLRLTPICLKTIKLQWRRLILIYGK